MVIIDIAAHVLGFFYPCPRHSRMYIPAVRLDNNPMPPISTSPSTIAPHLLLPREPMGSSHRPLSYYQVSTTSNPTQPDHLDTSGIAIAHILPDLRRRRFILVYHCKIVCTPLPYPLPQPGNSNLLRSSIVRTRQTQQAIGAPAFPRLNITRRHILLPGPPWAISIPCYPQTPILPPATYPARHARERTRAADIDSRGRRLGGTRLGGDDHDDDKDALPVYDFGDRPPQYAEVVVIPPPEVPELVLRFA